MPLYVFHEPQYDKKYPYLHYEFRYPSGKAGRMWSIPVEMLAEMYKTRIGEKPKSFFDCGAATGMLMWQAEMLGITARGIDIQEYPDVEGWSSERPLTQFFQTPPQKANIEIVSLLDYEKPIDVDLSYCNGTLTYFTESTLGTALAKLHFSKMLIAIHNTSEDIEAAEAEYGKDLTHGKPRLIQPKDWWMERIAKAGFDVDYDEKYSCFCAISAGRESR
jgi:hypothetical protein